MKTTTWAALVFILIMGALGYIEVSDHLKYSKIAEKPVVAKASILDVESHRRKGKTKYTVQYEFEANGSKVADSMSLSSGAMEKMADAGGSFEVVYNGNDPAHHAMKSGFDRRRNLKDLIVVLLKLAGFSAVVSLVIGFFLSKKFGPKPTSRQAEPQAAA